MTWKELIIASHFLEVFIDGYINPSSIYEAALCFTVGNGQGKVLAKFDYYTRTTKNQPRSLVNKY